MGAMSHECERYESEWSKCVKEKKRVRVSCESEQSSSEKSHTIAHMSFPQN